MNRRANITNFFCADESGVCPSAAVRQGVRLHVNRKGNVAILSLFMGFVLFAVAAMVWNTGQTISSKLEMQTAADTAAYSSVVWTSRALNITTGTNMLIYRNASAYPIATAATATMIGVPLVYVIRFVIAMVRVAATGFVDWSEVVNWSRAVAMELPMFAVFLSEAIPAAPAQTIFYWSKVANLYAIQSAIVNAVPDLIERQRLGFEEDCGCRIELARPGFSGRILPPLRPGNQLSILPVLALHFPANFKGWNICCWGRIDPKDPVMLKILKKAAKSADKDGDSGGKDNGDDSKDEKKDDKKNESAIAGLNPCNCSNVLNLGGVKYGFAKVWWTIGLITGFGAIVALPPQHHVLTTQWGPLEFGPSSLRSWRDFTVTAAATTDIGDRFMAPGVFDGPDTVTAYAQAETYNSVDQTLRSTFGFSLPYPFRVWTDWGWKWEPRLTLGDQLKSSITHDPQLEDIFAELGAEPADVAPIPAH